MRFCSRGAAFIRNRPSSLASPTRFISSSQSRFAPHDGNLWSHTEMAPADPILGLVAAFKASKATNKVNLAQGAYRDTNGQPLVLESTRVAERAIANDNSLDKEYLPIEGDAEFCKLSAEFLFGTDPSTALAQGRVATVQTISGTGSLRVCGALLKQVAGLDSIYLPNPSWGTHAKIFGAAGLNVKYHTYINSTKTGLDYDGMLADLSGATVPEGSAVLLHACAHNPTGCDPSLAQWEELAGVFKQRGLVPVFDSAYQGYATGNPEVDAAAVRIFEKSGTLPLVCQSFAKNMGLYGERVGALNVTCESVEQRDKVLSQLKTSVIRPMYSSPPLHGARIAKRILGDQTLRDAWLSELQQMSDRILLMRTQLRDELEQVGAPSPSALGDWQHIVTQIGMFAFTGLNSERVAQLQKEYNIYLTTDGRMSIAGLTPNDIPYVASSIKAVMEQD